MDKKILGQGAFTTVYKDNYKGTPCAIKHIDDKDNSKRYVRKEVNIYKTLKDCKYVVKMLDYKLCSHGYIKYEMLDKNLLQILSTLKRDDICKITEQLREALNEIHSSGVVHCDLKPENIMFDFEGNLKLIDFGNAMFIDELKTTKQSINTLPYRPPEYIIGAPMDKKVDTWAMGCVIMEMLTGDQLFNPRRDNMLYVHSFLLGEMITIFGDFKSEFIESGKYSSRYFDMRNKYTYLYKYLLGINQVPLYRILRNYRYSKEEARQWANILAEFFIR